MEKKQSDRAAEEWLNSYAKNTRWTYKTLWKYFREFTGGLTGDQVLESRRADKTYAWEKRVLAFRTWIVKKKGLSEYTARSSANSIRAFFAYHRLDLKFRRTEAQKLHEAKRKTEDYRFSVADLKKMSDVADLKEKYVVIAGKSFGLRAGDFLTLTRGDLEPYIEREPPISIGELATQKEAVKAFPFIDTDAKPIIKLTIETMDRQGKVNPNDRILDFKNIIELSRTLRRVTKRAGIKIGNKRVRFHCLRKFLIDHFMVFVGFIVFLDVPVYFYTGELCGEDLYVHPERSD